MRLLEASRLIKAVFVAIGHDNVALFGHINREPRVFAQMRRMHPGSQLADADVANVFGHDATPSDSDSEDRHTHRSRLSNQHYATPAVVGMLA